MATVEKKKWQVWSVLDIRKRFCNKTVHNELKKKLPKVFIKLKNFPQFFVPTNSSLVVTLCL